MGGHGATWRICRDDEQQVIQKFPPHWQEFPDWPPTELSSFLIDAILPDCLKAENGSLASLLEVKEQVATRLIVYGTLAPGMENSDQLADLQGRWFEARVPGRIDRNNRYPFFYPGTELCHALLFESEALNSRWSDLDRFEGSEYRRIWWPVLVNEKWTLANLYAARLS